jgi:hypothetical protein
MQAANFVLSVLFYLLLILRINEVIVCSWWWIFAPTILSFLIGFVNGVKKIQKKNNLEKKILDNIEKDFSDHLDKIKSKMH